MCDGMCKECGCCGDVVDLDKPTPQKKTFFVDFSGYCEIEAETREQAETEFWRLVQEELPLPQNIYDIEGIEEKTE